MHQAIKRLCGNSLEAESIPNPTSVHTQLLNLVVESLVFVLADFLDGAKPNDKSTASDKRAQTSARALLNLVAEVLEQEAKLQIETVSESGDKAAMERRHDAWRSPALIEALAEFCKDSNPSNTRRVAKHIQCVLWLCVF